MKLKMKFIFYSPVKLDGNLRSKLFNEITGKYAPFKALDTKLIQKLCFS